MECCNEINIYEILKQLSDEVAILGYEPIPLTHFQSDDNAANKVILSLSNIVSDLIRTRQNMVDQMRESRHVQCASNDEIKSLKSKINKLENEVKKSEKLVNSSANQNIQIKKHQVIADGDTKKLKQELLRAQGLIKSRSEQSTVKLQDLQQENAELKRKLRNLLQDDTGKKLSMAQSKPSILREHNHLPSKTVESKRTLNEKKEDLYMKSINRLQNNIQILVLENKKLKLAVKENIN